jgi:hypothetical protein
LKHRSGCLPVAFDLVLQCQRNGSRTDLHGRSGYQTGTNEYVSDSVTIPAGEQGQIFWTDADFVEGIDGLVSISCNLPPGVGVNDTYINWIENDAEAPAP